MARMISEKPVSIPIDASESASLHGVIGSCLLPWQVSVVSTCDLV